MRAGFSFNWDSVGLGKEPDSAIAARLGVPRRTVCKERNRRNIPKFGGLYLLQEGDPCRSIYEVMYDAYLHSQDIDHEHEVPIGSMIADFKVGNEYREIAGMLGFAKYAQRHQKKVQQYVQLGVSVVWLKIEDIERLYKDCGTTIKFCSERKCRDCNKQTIDLVKAVCRNCYMKRWHTGEPNATCPTCKNKFYAEDSDKFCSHECYSKSLCSTEWPILADLEKMLLSTSRRDIAARLGVSRGALDQHLHRKRRLHGSSGDL